MKKFKRLLLYRIAHLLAFLPDSWMLRLQYLIRTGRVLHLNHPQRLSEKLQHYKAYYRNPLMKQCVDKYSVREFVKERLGTDRYLNEMYQICDHPEEIDFASLPNQFVIKTTDGGSGDNVLICKDKEKLDIPSAVAEIKRWQNKHYPVISREWAYGSDKGSRIIVEKYLEDPHNPDGAIDDYKFMCFNGKMKCMWVDKDRFIKHTRCLFDEQLQCIEGVEFHFGHTATPIPLPENVSEMVSIAEQLATGFPFARIDLYNLDGKILFGEVTFYPESGYGQFRPDNYDFKWGSFFDTESYGVFDKRKKK